MIQASLAGLLALNLFAAAPQTPPSADELFAKRRYAEALPLYEAQLKSKDENVRLRALYRAVECRALAFRYLEAVDLVEKAALPKEGPWRARLLLLKAEAQREAATQYGHGAPADAEEGSQDSARRTEQQWRDLAQASFASLYPLRASMAARPLAQESEYVVVQDADLTGTPAQWDFAVSRWSDFLLSRPLEPAAAKPDPASLLVEDYGRRWSKEDAPAAQAAALMEEASRLAGSKDERAREHWKLRRSKLPLDRPDLFSPAKGDLGKAATALWTGWVDRFTAPSARAEAGYFAAERHNSSGAYAEAVALCRRLERDFPKERGTARCAQMRVQIEQPVLGLSARLVAPPGNKALQLSARNIGTVHLRLLKTSVSELAGFMRRYNPHDWTALRSLEQGQIEEFSRRRPDQAWTQEMKPSAPHAHASAESQAPRPLAPGLYVALASSDERFEPKQSMLSAVIVNVTDLFLVATSGPQGSDADFVWSPQAPQSITKPAFHYYTLDAHTGRPAPASLSVWFRDRRGQSDKRALASGEDGMAQQTVDFDLRYGHGNGASADPLATRGDAHAYGQGGLWASHGVPAPIQLHLDLDRPIYRPGQTVRGKLTALKRMPRGYAVYDGAQKVSLSVLDANHQMVASRTLTLDGYGAAAFEAEIPAGRLLGRYSVSASMSEYGHGFSGYEGFSVEEYKRPEFEVTLAASTGPWRYDRRAVVAGDAKYYFGAAVPDAAVTWRVVRRDWIPWFCWWWRPRGGGDVEMAHGEARTDAEGRFTFAFTPKPSDADAEDPRPAEFLVTAEARDAGGRTITAARSYRAGAKAYLFSIAPPTGFLKASAASSIPVKLMTLDEQAVAGKARWSLRRLEGAPPDTPDEGAWHGWFPPAPSLDALYEKAADGASAGEGVLELAAKTGAALKLPPLAEGVYRLSIAASDPWGGESAQKVVLLSVSDDPSAANLPLPAVALPERSSYLSGETARVLVGSARLDASFLEVWGGSTLLERRRLPKGLQLVSVRVGDDHKGGFTARWFGAKNFRIRAGQASASVPWADKELTLKLEPPSAVEPGRKVSWPLVVKNREGKRVDAQALVRVFDRSLEYYQAQAASWTQALYARHGSPGQAQGSHFAPWAQSIAVERDELREMLRRYDEALRVKMPPHLRISRGRAGWGYGYGRRYGGMKSTAIAAMRGAAASESSLEFMQASGAMLGGGAGMAFDAAPAAAPMVAREENALAKNEGRGDKKKDASPAAPPVAVRSDFSETAWFEPRLHAKDGIAKLAFTMPERLTSWKIQAVALTKDAAAGGVTALTATKKDLMVRVEMPRFLREGDEAVLIAVAHNETGAEMSGAVTLSANRDGKPAEADLSLDGAALEKPFTIPAHGQKALSWTVKAPRGTGTFEVTAVARSGEKADAERRDLPLLPSRQRLVESVLTVLDGTVKKTLRIARFFEKDATRENESMTLKLDPQLALSVLDSLPFLVHYPHECVEQVLNRYVPLSIVESFYKKDPRIAAAVSKIPKRTTITRPWDRKDPRRLIQLQETPWEHASRGHYGGPWVVDLLDPALVERERAEALSTLLSYQNHDGSFPWFPGGRGDLYMTLTVLAGWAEAQRYGVEIPMHAARRALSYVQGEIPQRLKAQPGEVSLVLYAAYVITSFGSQHPEARKGFLMAKAWVDYADKHGEALTPVGRAYAAHVYARLGEKQKSADYLDRAMDGARKDPVAGVYFTPEKLSWLWYNDSVETHAFLLKTLLALRPKDERIAGMAQWLLFNRVGNEWKSTKASAAAIYSLLDLLRSRGALDRGDSYSVSWGAKTERASVEPLQWLEKPLRYTREAGAIGPKDGQAVIEKSGPGLAFASLTWTYSTDAPVKASDAGMTALGRKYFKRIKDGTGWKLVPLADGAELAVGDQLEVHLTVSARSQFEYVHLKDPKPAGFEAETLTSGWKWDNLGRYEEPRDSLTNFFMSWLPHGEYVLRYRLRATTPGVYKAGAAVLQSMYAPEITAHSDSFTLKVN
jgi:hypothetical protein